MKKKATTITIYFTSRLLYKQKKTVEILLIYIYRNCYCSVTQFSTSNSGFKIKKQKTKCIENKILSENLREKLISL